MVWQHFVPGSQDHCKKNNLAFKVVLFLDNAPGHAKYLVGRHPCVQVVFLPPNTTSKLQPLDQEVIANVKILFYGMIHNKMRMQTNNQQEIREIAADLSGSGNDSEPEESEEPVLSVKMFWKWFKIKAVDIFCDACCQINTATIKHAWTPLLPALSPDTSDHQEQAVLARESWFKQSLVYLSTYVRLRNSGLVGEDGDQ